MPFMGECGGLHMDTVDSSDSLSHFMDHTTTTYVREIEQEQQGDRETITKTPHSNQIKSNQQE